MKVGASYYPEVLPRAEWERDLATGREIGLSCLRCGEFAWSAFSRDGDAWTPEWALDFLALAHQYGYDIIWGTPSASPPPYIYDRWPELHAVNVDGHRVPSGVRRHYCPSHAEYRTACAEMAERLARTLSGAPALVGWQIDNEIAGDGFTCWCPTCRTAFQQWLQARYGSLEALNAAWQTGVWSQTYTAWSQIPLPAHPFTGAHAPALRLAYRRFRSDNWLAFYRAQREALQRGGAQQITTNFYNITWDVPFDQWAWRPEMDTIGISHYLEDENASRFQLALLQGAQPGAKPLWVLEQKAGQQNAQNLYPENLARLEQHLRICAESGAEYAVYWHLRQHAAGCEMEHGAVLRHDGKATRIAHAIAEAIRETATVPHAVPPAENLLVFSFEQHWANEQRPQPGTRWSYWQEVETAWYGGAREALDDIRIGPWQELTTEHRLVLAPFLQLEEPGVLERLRACLEAGATVITTVDLARLDQENNVQRQPPLGALRAWLPLPALEVLHLKETFVVEGRLGHEEACGHLYWVLLDDAAGFACLGEATTPAYNGPLALSCKVGAGTLIIALTALLRGGVAALVRHVQSQTTVMKAGAGSDVYNGE